MAENDVVPLGAFIKPGTIPSAVKKLQESESAVVLTIDRANRWHVEITGSGVDAFRALGMLQHLSDQISDLIRRKASE